MRERYFVVIIIILIIAVAPRVADASVDKIQYNKDSLTVEALSFRAGSSVVDSEYKNNEVTLGRIHPIFAIKTNLLYDAFIAINLEVEVSIGDRWSIAGEYIFPWWLSNKRQRCLQSLSGFVEGRYWFGDRAERRQLSGWFAGVYAGGGYYDVEWNDKGYQGEFFIPFALSGGYSHSIGRNLSLEYSLGVGYMQTNYRKYNSTLCSDGDMRLIKTKEDTYRWFGPTKVKVSLVWMINYRKGGAK